jgi:hypothetical protein
MNALHPASHTEYPNSLGDDIYTFSINSSCTLLLKEHPSGCDTSKKNRSHFYSIVYCH